MNKDETTSEYTEVLEELMEAMRASCTLKTKMYRCMNSLLTKDVGNRGGIKQGFIKATDNAGRMHEELQTIVEHIERGLLE